MKARRARLASPNWRHLQGLDTQCWQRNPPFNYGVVTMVTTYSTPISITLHMALCEGHTTSENPKHQKWKLWLFLPGELSQDGGGVHCRNDRRYLHLVVLNTVRNGWWGRITRDLTRHVVNSTTRRRYQRTCYYDPAHTHPFMRSPTWNTILCTHYNLKKPQ